MAIPDHLTCLLRNLYAGQEARVRTGHEQLTGSQLENEYIKAVYSILGKEYIKAVYCPHAYLTYMHGT